MASAIGNATGLSALILSTITEQLSGFKVNFLDLVRTNAEKAFRKIPARIESLRAKIQIINRQTQENSTKANPAAPSWKANAPLYKEKHRHEDEIARCERAMIMGIEAFVAKVMRDAEESFDDRVKSLSYKLDKKGFPSELTFSQIHCDPKLFDVIIAGNGKKVHARSILAAENSECMVPHFRFIVTDAK